MCDFMRYFIFVSVKEQKQSTIRFTKFPFCLLQKQTSLEEQPSDGIQELFMLLALCEPDDLKEETCDWLTVTRSLLALDT